MGLDAPALDALALEATELDPWPPTTDSRRAQDGKTPWPRKGIGDDEGYEGKATTTTAEDSGMGDGGGGVRKNFLFFFFSFFFIFW
jgi:hypothetical protein